MTSTYNLKNSINNFNINKTHIYLEDCEILLRKYYNLSNNETIYMKKLDIKQEGMKIPKIEYDVYSKLSGSNLTKLNLSLCENSQIFLSIPVNISENIDKLNSSSGYYNNLCYITRSDEGFDLILKDRQKEFIEKNKTLCQEDCAFYEYNYDKQIANCSCKIKEASTNFEDMNINITKLYENFGSINDKTELSNLGITACNVFSSTENIETNTGFYLLLFILVIFIIIFIIFYKKGYNLLENKMDEIIYEKFEKETKPKKSQINII